MGPQASSLNVRNENTLTRSNEEITYTQQEMKKIQKNLVILNKKLLKVINSGSRNGYNEESISKIKILLLSGADPNHNPNIYHSFNPLHDVLSITLRFVEAQIRDKNEKYRLIIDSCFKVANILIESGADVTW